MIYSAWLFGFSLLFVAIERLWPRRRQALFRRGIASDIAYLMFNSEYLGLFMGLISIHSQSPRSIEASILRMGAKRSTWAPWAASRYGFSSSCFS